MPGKQSSQPTESRFGEATDWLRSRLPPGWRVKVTNRRGMAGTIRVQSANGAAGDLRVLAADRVDPRTAMSLPRQDGPMVVAAPWLSPRARTLLDGRGIGYLDATGNTKILMTEPGLYIYTQGSGRDPDPRPERRPSLRGTRAWALLRTLAEVAPPYGIRELAASLGVDAGYVSRVVGVLEDELLVERASRGPLTAVDWEGVLRQLVNSYSVFTSNQTTSWIAPGGPAEFFSLLSGTRVGRWAATGSFPSSKIAPVAGPELAVIYAEDADRVARAARLLPASSGVNVVIARPYDPIVYERVWSLEGLPCASLAQVVIDDLTGSGRMPAEGEALLSWMRRDPARWQAPSLTRPAPDIRT